MVAGTIIEAALIFMNLNMKENIALKMNVLRAGFFCGKL